MPEENWRIRQGTTERFNNGIMVVRLNYDLLTDPRPPEATLLFSRGWKRSPYRLCDFRACCFSKGAKPGINGRSAAARYATCLQNE